MKKTILFCLFGCLSVIAFASFPVETQALIADNDPFKLDALGFIIGILTMPFLFLYGLPLLLLFINKKHFRKSLVLGWLASLVLIIIIIIIALAALAAESDFRFLS